MVYRKTSGQHMNIHTVNFLMINNNIYQKLQNLEYEFLTMHSTPRKERQLRDFKKLSV